MTPDQFDLQQHLIAGTTIYRRLKGKPGKTKLDRQQMNEAKMIAWYAARELRILHHESMTQPERRTA